VTTPEDPNAQDPYTTPQPSVPDPSQPPPAAPPPPPYGQAPPQYGAPPPQYGQPYGGYPAQAVGTNGFAIASLICAFLCSPLGLIFGLVAKSQIKSRGGGGDGLATAGIILSAIFLAVGILLAATGNATFHVGSGSS
jgi:hypothetical protein